MTVNDDSDSDATTEPTEPVGEGGDVQLEILTDMPAGVYRVGITPLNNPGPTHFDLQINLQTPIRHGLYRLGLTRVN